MNSNMGHTKVHNARAVNVNKIITDSSSSSSMLIAQVPHFAGLLTEKEDTQGTKRPQKIKYTPLRSALQAAYQPPFFSLNVH